MRMKNETTALLSCAVLLLCGALLTSCSKEYFDDDEYVKAVSNAFPVSDIDEDHEWVTTEVVSASVNLEAWDGEYLVYFYDADPAEGDARLLNTALVEGSDVSRFTVPTSMDDEVYVVATAADGEGEAYLGCFTIDDGDLSVSASGFGSTPVSCDVSTSVPKEYTFVFEKDFPVPGDYDFNDVVMSISMEKAPAGTAANSTTKDIIYLTVTLRAVGCTEQVAGCLRLLGTSSSIISSTYTCPTEEFFVNGDIANEDYVPINTKSAGRYFSANGTAERCIVLFNDAHYAISGINADTENYGVRPSYNTSYDDGAYATSEKTNVYAITFSSGGGYTFKYFNVTDNLDPFIVTAYNGAYYETHTYPYKIDEVAHYWRTAVSGDVSNYYTDNYPWALLCPGEFSYPLEGQVIGLYTSNILSGAYQSAGHSFGEWARDHTAATDWYEYPRASLVY